MDFSRIDKLTDEIIEAGGIPSAVIAVGDGSGVLYKKAFGYSRYYPDGVCPSGPYPEEKYKSSVRAGISDLYDLASLTKLISTTMVALRLVEEGIICLSDTVEMFFQNSFDKGSISIKDLMTHQSGIAPFFMLSDGYSSGDKDSYIINRILSAPFDYTPHSDVRYSCMGYILLGKIIELVTGEKLDILAKKLVFDPLGMVHTGFKPKKNVILSKLTCAVTEYDPESRKFLDGIVHDENARFQDGVSANAGLFSNIDDLCIFAEMLSNKGRQKNDYFLSPSSFELAISNHTPGKSEYRGLGFALKDEGMYPTGELFSPLSYGHTGYTGTSLFVDRETGLYLIILTNRVHFTRESNDLYRFRRKIGNVVKSTYERSL